MKILVLIIVKMVQLKETCSSPRGAVDKKSAKKTPDKKSAKYPDKKSGNTPDKKPAKSSNNMGNYFGKEELSDKEGGEREMRRRDSSPLFYGNGSLEVENHSSSTNGDRIIHPEKPKKTDNSSNDDDLFCENNCIKIASKKLSSPGGRRVHRKNEVVQQGTAVAKCGCDAAKEGGSTGTPEKRVQSGKGC